MLNGQLSLTGISHFAGARAFESLQKSVIYAGLLGCVFLAGCTTGTRAPVVDLTNAPPAQGGSPAAGSTYVVKPGDTLYKIARGNGVDVDTLKRWNGMSDSNVLSVGQVLKLSAPAGGGAVAPVGSRPVTKPSEQSTEPTPLPPPGEPQPTTPTAPPSTTPEAPPATQPPPAVASTPTPARAPDAGMINWAWPSAGQLIQTFNANTKGIDIGGNAGDPVTAAADGKVMYSGNGVRGLGNLIIINHNNGFITAYAHNRALLVKTGQEVKRGTKVAEIGQTDAASPRLHFEIRRQGTPVDPLQYLPAR
ncbi:peptidoglycan DD-metalloendopeptidase family protein [Bordetella sp. N]|uniref:peptidoglycan DD-metalloendopeptidase family protein n=1 Tax=Bordetella sp. N TaxID=1746199 RepID=UPI000710EB7F|nr:peptidoglycan DD-metalloendopeptidase family protein [Bordetella sp. N]ALM82519.1 peptidase [Bordetella sp. N]